MLENNLITFEGNNIEILEFNDKILFNPYHIGKCLGLKDRSVRKAIQSMNETQVLKLTNALLSDGTFNTFRKLNNAGEKFLTESGVYQLVLQSRKPEAKKFSNWITDEVLPEIRKTGSYIVDNRQANINALSKLADRAESPDEIDAIISLMNDKKQLMIENNDLKREIEVKDQQIALSKPKVEFYDGIAEVKGLMGCGDVAKLICNFGHKIGRTRFMEWLRSEGYLCKSEGQMWNKPRQLFVEQGYMEVKTRTTYDKFGRPIAWNNTPFFTPKGVRYIIRQYIKFQEQLHTTNCKSEKGWK